MAEAADTVEMGPDRLSFTRTLHIIRRRITDAAEFSPAAQQTLRNRDIKEILERTNNRRPVSYPRVHKSGNRHNFPTKKPEHRQHRYELSGIVLNIYRRNSLP